jgi:GNAT superfamily N-acetyltransferase
MRIARARPGDPAALTRIAFGAERHWGYPEGWIRRWTDLLTLTPEYVRANPTFAARKGTGIAGFGSLKIRGGEARLDHPWVVPGVMGMGVGTALFRHCGSVARRRGASRLRVEADPNAEGFCHLMGASSVGRRRAPVAGRERFLPLLGKSLSREGRSLSR